MKKLTINSKDILKAVQVVGSLIKPQNTMPVLDNILFKINPGKLELVADNLEVRSCNEIDIESDFEHQVCIPFNLLSNILKGLTNGPVDFVFEEKSLNLKTTTGEYKIPIAPEDVKAFPADNFEEAEGSVTYNSLELVEAIKKAAAFADPANTNVLGKVLFWTGDCTRIVGFNMHGGFEGTLDVKGPENKMLLTRGAATYLAASITENDDLVVTTTGNHVYFSIGKRKISAVLAAERYPNYEVHFNSDRNKILKITKDEFSPVLKRLASVTDNTSHIVRFNFSNDTLEMNFAHSAREIKAKETIKVNYQGEPMLVGLSVNNINNTLNVFDEAISFEFSEANKPCVVTEGNTRCIIMPFLLAD